VTFLRGISRTLAWFNRLFNSGYDAAHPYQRRQLEQIEAAEREASGRGTHDER
jgi:hypothetical protein